MNIRLKYETSFLAAVHFNQQFLIGSYSVTLSMLTNTVDPYEQNIAFNRLRYMIEEVFYNTIFINQEDTKQCKLYINAGCKISNLPEDPLDQIIGIMLYSKLSAVMEDKMFITNLDLSSDLGDSVVYSHSIDEARGPFVQPGWWNDAAPTYCDKKFYAKRKEDRIVELKNNNSWHGLDLLFESDPASDSTESTVLYADFTKDEH